MQVIYIDVLFLLNALMDLMIFTSTAILLDKKIKKHNLIIGSCLASFLYCATVVIPVLQKIPSYLIMIILPVVPLLIIFKFTRLKEFIKGFIVAHVASFLMGGLAFNIYYVVLQKTANSTLSFWLPVLTGIGINGVLYSTAHYIRQRFIRPRFEYGIQIINEKDNVHLRGYLDTGNSLYTVFEHKPVNIVTYESIYPLLDKDKIKAIEGFRNKGIEGLYESSKDQKGIYLIPFHSVGCKEGMLIGIKVSCVQLRKGYFKENYKDCIMGIAPGELFKDNHYDILIHPDFIVNDKGEAS